MDVAVAPSRVSLLSWPSPRRIAALFSRPPSPKARIASIASLYDHLLVADRATSSAALCGVALDRQQAVAWDLFSPLQRLLLVSVVAAAVSKSLKIQQLQRSVELRDEVLEMMQRKLNDLMSDESMKSTSMNHFFTETSVGAGNDWNVPKDLPINEPEERRMSDLSDFNWSVVSSADFQLNTLAAEQELYNLQKECKEQELYNLQKECKDKDAKIEELTMAIHASNVDNSKRITELEDIVTRKNMIISRLKNDMMHLEQQVTELTRLRRASLLSSKPNSSHVPLMSENILYDMSSTSSSSSDPDSPVTSRKSNSRELPKDHQQPSIESMERRLSSSSNVSLTTSLLQQSAGSQKKSKKVQKSEPVTRLRQRQLANVGKDSMKTRSQERLNARRWT